MPLVNDGLPTPLKRIHIMGVCGTAMGSIAGMLKDAGFEVRGSDTGVYPPMSDYLAELEIPIMEGFVASNLEWAPDLVVVGNVIRAIYEEASALTAGELPYCSFPHVLGELFLKDAHSIVVAGTHGKTTTTAIAAWLADRAGAEPGYLVGGIVQGWNRTARAGGGKLFVIEGDEYDTAFFDKQPKFVHYRANTAILTSVETSTRTWMRSRPASSAWCKHCPPTAAWSPVGTTPMCARSPQTVRAPSAAMAPVRSGMGRSRAWIQRPGR